MRIHGWCERCHRVRLVRVTSQGLIRLAMGSAAIGICDECEDNDLRERAERFRERSRR